MRNLFLIFTIIILSGVVSCRNQGFVIRPTDTVQDAFDKAYVLFENEEWLDAARAFTAVQQYSRDTELGADTQFYLAESYYNSRQYLLAAAEYERFLSFYRNSPRREEVQFKVALSYYQQSNRYNLDQEETYQAIEQFDLFATRYPDSERIDEAGAYIEELVNKLAQKSYAAAEFYYRTGSYEAAAIKYGEVLDEYPGTIWAERALAKQIESYILYADNSITERQDERYQMAIDKYEQYLQLFPRGENRTLVEALYDRAREQLVTAAN